MPTMEVESSNNSVIRYKRALKLSRSRCHDACKSIAHYSQIRCMVGVGGVRTPTLFGRLPKDLIRLICGMIWERRNDIEIWKKDDPIFEAIKQRATVDEIDAMLQENRKAANAR